MTIAALAGCTNEPCPSEELEPERLLYSLDVTEATTACRRDLAGESLTFEEVFGDASIDRSACGSVLLRGSGF